MATRLFSPAVSIGVLGVLVALTLLTVGLSFVPSSPTMRIVAGQSIALVKAALVALFFMHALRSPAAVRAVIVVSIAWLMVVLMSLTFCDYVTRGLLPNLPGH